MSKLETKWQVVIVGAGFAGLNAAKILGAANIPTLLIDRNNHHLFQPLLYQVATAGLSPADIATPIRSIFRRHPSVEVALAEVVSIAPKEKQLTLKDGRHISFSYLLLATGATHAYFGHPEWESFAPGLKNLEDAIEIRRRVLSAFEMAEFETNESAKARLLTFVIVGGGPTGVEVAGAIAELSRFALNREFRNINPRNVKILLLEAASRILRAFAEDLSMAASKKLRALGVDVREQTRVTDIDETLVKIDNGEAIAAYTKIWAAGVSASPLAQLLQTPTDPSGRINVESDLSLAEYPHIFVAGDLAHVIDAKGHDVPAMAPGAIQGGRHAARNILRTMRHARAEAFKYHDKGSLAAIGRTFAIAEVGRWRFSGLLARALWVFVHITYLIGFRNKLIVMIEWAWAFFTFKRGARLITQYFQPRHGSSK